MKHYKRLDNPTDEQLDGYLSNGWAFYSEETQIIVLQRWYPQYINNGITSVRGSDLTETHWLVTLVKED
jgi:hypothetical protein